MTMMKCKNFLSFWNAFNSILYFLSTKLHYVHYKLNWKKANLKRQNESSPFLELKLISIILKDNIKSLKCGYLKLLKKWYASLLVLFKNPKISTHKGSFFNDIFGSISTLNLPFFCNAMRVEEDPEMQVQFKKSIFKWLSLQKFLWK